MAKSIFSKQHEGDPDIKRNTFDLSFANSLTMEMGKLYPVFCKEVIPGDSFRIDSAFGLRFMPMAFPVQTKMRANLQFFYVRNRNLWDKWQQFITKTGQPDEFPYVDASRYCKTNSLGDFFGLPTTVVGTAPLVDTPLTARLGSHTPTSGASGNVSRCGGFYYDYGRKGEINFKAVPVASTSCTGTSNGDYLHGQYINVWFDNLSTVVNHIDPNQSLEILFSYTPNASQESNVVPEDLTFCLLTTDSNVGPLAYYQLPLRICSTGNCTFYSKGGKEYMCVRFTFLEHYNFTGRYAISIMNGTSGRDLSFYFDNGGQDVLPSVSNLSAYLAGSEPQELALTGNVIPGLADFGVRLVVPEMLSDVERYSKYNVSALPFRAYESIYNAFYRDDRNNPYVVNGVSDPNVYLPTKAGGLDTNEYVLHRVNWEQDFLTTAVPSPQQGPAPLVGITSSGKATFMDSDGNEYNAQFNVGDDGDTVTSVDFPDANIPSSARQTAIALATEGISINDFRNVNALQRWLETNMRKGYKYKDQIASHFGVNISYAELDMPEFIGGVSQLADIQQVNQTSASDVDNPLGSYAGQASVVGGNNHTISTYCDEHGFIIGLFYVVPTPTYSQLLPKHFLKFDPMDYFFPEFGHLGYQPVKYDEVCPLQARLSGVSLTDTFGYQRAWYDYLQSVDEVHGDFRTTLQSFILSRVFKSVPSLVPDFLTVSQDQLNEIFTVTEVNGEPVRPILGQLYFDVLAKRKIPRYGVPRLE